MNHTMSLPAFLYRYSAVAELLLSMSLCLSVCLSPSLVVPSPLSPSSLPKIVRNSPAWGFVQIWQFSDTFSDYFLPRVRLSCFTATNACALQAASLKKCTLQAASLKKCTLQAASLKKCTLQAASLKKCTLQAASLKKCTLQAASLKKCTHITMSSCSLSCVPSILQGSGTFAVEAALTTSIPRKRPSVLVIANGSYGHRLAEIVNALPETGTCVKLTFPEDTPMDLEKIEGKLLEMVRQQQMQQIGEGVLNSSLVVTHHTLYVHIH